MIYSVFTDTELRRVIDNDPGCAAARDEAARRFLHGSEELAELIAEREQLGREVSRLEDELAETYDAYADK